jgi:hypothetical protein
MQSPAAAQDILFADRAPADRHLSLNENFAQDQEGSI